MSLKNLLDLRKKVEPQIKIVERIIFQKRSLKKDIFLTLSVIFVASAVIWGITKADTSENIKSSRARMEQANLRSKNFSVVGVVFDVSETTLSIDTQSSNDSSKTIYTLNTDTVVKIETRNYKPLTLSDIKIGDKVVVQGMENEGNITIKRIISFGIATDIDTATSTATTSDETASTTDTATSTLTIIDTIKDVVTGVIDVITGSTTPDEQVGTTSDTTATSSDDNNSTTIPEDTSSSTDTTSSEPKAEDPPKTDLLENIIDGATDVLNNIIGNGDATTQTDSAQNQTDTPAPTDQISTE